MASLTATVYLGLGANVGDRLANLRMALARLQTLARLEEVSSLYETQPQGVSDQAEKFDASGVVPESIQWVDERLPRSRGRARRLAARRGVQ
ncbi:MAG: 2-amino-4-hydroxy-6-hydroxymethyldihydropteridine diphosphokinase [Dehalococcoidia bacterium]